VRPYFSPDDVAKGTRWATEIARELEACRVGLICLTPDNLTEPWLMFEAGALAKSLDSSRVCPLLFGGVEPSDLTGPLAQFQSARFEAAEVKRVLRTINAAMEDSALPTDVLNTVFEKWWPELERDIATELERAPQQRRHVRPEREILQELLELSRGIMRFLETPRFGRGPGVEYSARALNYLRNLTLALRRSQEPSWPPWRVVLADEGELRLEVSENDGTPAGAIIVSMEQPVEHSAVELKRTLELMGESLRVPDHGGPSQRPSST
jgi:hypothetical protein